MYRIAGVFVLLLLPVAIVTNLFKALAFYLERVGKIAYYGLTLTIWGRKGMHIIVSKELRDLSKKNIELLQRKKDLLSLVETT